MESKDITKSVKDKVRESMALISETMMSESMIKELPPSLVCLKELQDYFLECTEDFLTEVFSKYEEICMREHVQKTNLQNDESKNTQPEKTHGVNAVHPTGVTSTIEDAKVAAHNDISEKVGKASFDNHVKTIEVARAMDQKNFFALAETLEKVPEHVLAIHDDYMKPEEVGKSRCGPEITEEIATIEQQKLIAEGAKMNEEMLTPNAEQPDSGLSLKNQTLDEEMITLQAKQPDSDRSLKKQRCKNQTLDEEMITLQAKQPDSYRSLKKQRCDGD